MLNWENKLKDLCVVCSKSLHTSSYYLCIKCKNVCDVSINKVIEEGTQYITIDIKSKCCNSDVITNQRTTCSEECHLSLISQMEKDFGKFKKVIDSTTDIPYKVPVKDIIEKGLNPNMLQNYEKWSE